MKQSIYDHLLGTLCSVLEAYSAVLFMPGANTPPDSGECTVISAFSLGDKLHRKASVKEGQGLVGWILRNSEPLLVANFDQRKNHLGYYKDAEEQNIKAFIGCPLKGRRGVLCVDSKRQYSFAEKDQKILYLFADLVASMQDEMDTSSRRAGVRKYYTALRTIYSLRHEYSRWPEFLQIFLGLMASTTGFDYCLFCTRDSHGQNYVVEGENTRLLLQNTSGVKGGTQQAPPVYSMSNGIVGWVFREGKPVVSDVRERMPETPLVRTEKDVPQFQTIAAFPLIIQRKTRGVLCLAHASPLLVDENTRDFVQMASEHLALFLENLYVKCKLRDLHRATKQ